MTEKKLLDFNDLLLYSIKITDEKGGQVMEDILQHYIKKLEGVGLRDCIGRVEQMTEEPNNGPWYQEGLTEEQNKLLIEVKNFIFFSSVISARNVHEAQLDLLRALSKEIVKMIEKDDVLKGFVNNIKRRVTADDHSKLYHEMFDLREKIKEKYNSSNELRTIFLNFELDNLEIIKYHKGQWQNSFIKRILYNADFIKREHFPQEIRDKMKDLMNSLSKPKMHERCFFKFLIKLCLFKTKGCKKRSTKIQEYNELRKIINKTSQNSSKTR